MLDEEGKNIVLNDWVTHLLGFVLNISDEIGLCTLLLLAIDSEAIAKLTVKLTDFLYIGNQLRVFTLFEVEVFVLDKVDIPQQLLLCL